MLNWKKKTLQYSLNTEILSAFGISFFKAFDGFCKGQARE